MVQNRADVHTKCDSFFCLFLLFWVPVLFPVIFLRLLNLLAEAMSGLWIFVREELLLHL